LKRRRSELTAEVIALRQFRQEVLAVLKFIVTAYDADKKRMLANGV
jgi:hypothetical protein